MLTLRAGWETSGTATNSPHHGPKKSTQLEANWLAVPDFPRPDLSRAPLRRQGEPVGAAASLTANSTARTRLIVWAVPFQAMSNAVP